MNIPSAPESRRNWVSTIFSPSVFLYLRGKERCIDWAFMLATSTEEILSDGDVGTGRLTKNPLVPSRIRGCSFCLHLGLVSWLGAWHMWFVQFS